mmetsp:Transcript_103204/g.292378  ORF Transcript_103204/g.292378 Transcript_103204/m.292378 type:complete len:338 (-) Transcript_103204:320-1333(-)
MTRSPIQRCLSLLATVPGALSLHALSRNSTQNHTQPHPESLWRYDGCDPNPPTAPIFCPEGQDHWGSAEMIKELPEFAKVYARRPITNDVGGVSHNHAFALWFTIRKLRPKHIIESGVWKGQTTWLMRQAAGNSTSLFSFDPFDRAEYREDHALLPGKYFMGTGFTDLSEIDWDTLIPEHERQDTLVMLDDHMSAIRRAKELVRWGFVHLWYDDNFSLESSHYRGAGCYSFSAMCSQVFLPPQQQTVELKDHWGLTVKAISMPEHEANRKYLLDHLDTYFEFPAIYDACNKSAPMLVQEDQLAKLGLPKVDSWTNGYTTEHPPYVKLRIPGNSTAPA